MGITAGFNTNYFYQDPLWDGAGCSNYGKCCEAGNWFCRSLPEPTTDDLEVQICTTSGPGDAVLELFIS